MRNQIRLTAAGEASTASCVTFVALAILRQPQASWLRLLR
jgi:hypothetical protein